MFRIPISVLLVAAMAFASSPVASAEPPPTASPLLTAVLFAGGGPAHFSARVFRGAFERVGIGCKSDPVALLAKFDKAFTYVVLSGTRGMFVSATPQGLQDAVALQAALRAAGTYDGEFDVERLFNTLFGATAHMRAMMDVADKYGPDAEGAYHTVVKHIVTNSCGGLQAPMKPMNDATNGMVMTGSTMVMGGATPTTTSMPMGVQSPTPMPDSTSMPAMKGMDAMAKNGETFSLKGTGAMGDMTMTVAQMPDTTDLAVGMGREGSGTSWMPDASPVYARMWMKGDDMWMQHGAAWLRYSHAGSVRGSDRLTVPDWYMMMLAHPLSAHSQIGFRAMLSADAALVGGSGYPLLFQTGETWKGQPLHDRQHPHDLFDELSATYSAMLGPRTSVALYLAYPGEPALGPPAFMHRAVAYDLADAPIGHHWQDATHITFGVATLGLGTGRFKLEGSLFNGREPNEVRTNFDRPRFDSASVRLSWNPNAFTAVQVSSGRVKSMEAADPDMTARRTTASIQYERPFGMTQWSQALVWGQNEENGQRSNSYLYEADYVTPAGSLFGRIENVQKSGKDLVLSPAFDSALYAVGAYTIGYTRDLPALAGHPIPGIGAQMTLNSKPASLAPFYGSAVPFSFELFFRLRGPRMMP